MLLASLIVVSVSLATAAAETIHGIMVVSRHGDCKLSVLISQQLIAHARSGTSKHYSDYTLTNLGYDQAFDVGSFFRDTYVVDGAPRKILGISPEAYVTNQPYAAAPDQQILLKTTTAFLQGLYPPFEDINALSVGTETLNNGTAVAPPLNGYQFVYLHSRQNNSPDTMWIKGDGLCPAFTAASATFKESAVFQDNIARTKPFYAQFWSILQNVWDYTPANLTYAKAYDIFDLIYVASIHNRTITANVTDDQMFQLRTLADSAEFNNNFNESQPARSIGGAALAGQIFTQLNQTVSSQGKLKLSVVTPSYNNQLGLFGLTKLTAASPDFFGLPPYASALTFELFTPTTMSTFPSNIDDLMVRAMFRNGSDGAAPLLPFALFGRPSLSVTWKDFSTEMLKVSITSTGQWCKTCNSTATFCLPYASANATAAPMPTPSGVNGQTTSGGGMSNAVAGVIGAMATFGFVLVGGLACFLLRRGLSKKKTAGEAAIVPREKSSSIGSSEV